MFTVKSCFDYRVLGTTADSAEAGRIAQASFIGDYDNVIFDGNGRVVGSGVEGFTGLRDHWEPGRDESAGSVLTGREWD